MRATFPARVIRTITDLKCDSFTESILFRWHKPQRADGVLEVRYHDEANVCFTQATFKREAFSLYESEGGILAFDADDLAVVAKALKPDETVTVEYDTVARSHMTVKSGGRRFKLRPLSMAGIVDRSPPTLKLPSGALLGAAELVDALKSVALIQSKKTSKFDIELVLHHTADDDVTLTGSDDTRAFTWSAREAGALHGTHGDSDQRALFGLEYIPTLLKPAATAPPTHAPPTDDDDDDDDAEDAAPIPPRVSLDYGSDMPLSIKYDLDAASSVAALIAPRFPEAP